jgi:hypothetical protein
MIEKGNSRGRIAGKRGAADGDEDLYGHKLLLITGLAVVAAMHLAFLPAAGAGTLTVTSTADSGPGTLRAALAVAADGDTIDASGVSGTILLTNGELVISKSVAIFGPGPTNLAVFGNNATTIFVVRSNTAVSIAGLFIFNGGMEGFSSGGGIYSDHATLRLSNCAFAGHLAYNGAAIYNDGSGSGTAALIVSHCLFFNNSADIFGGAIYNNGSSGGAATSRISDSTIHRSSARLGGGIYNDGYAGGAVLLMTNCTVSENTAAGEGGAGIYNDGESGSATVVIARSVLTRNTVDSPGNGGAIQNACGFGATAVTITDSTISDNQAYSGGGIMNDGSTGEATLTIINSTLSGNRAAGEFGWGGAIYSGGASLAIHGSTLSSNSAVMCAGAVLNGGGVSNATCLIANSTLSGNSAGLNGGAVANMPQTISSTVSLTLLNSTVNNNACTNGAGGAVWNDGEFRTTARLELGSTILNEQGRGSTIVNAPFSGQTVSNAAGTVISLGYNLSSDHGGGFLNRPTDLLNTDPMLGLLQDNGGPTFTHALLCGSPAIDSGRNFAVSPYDQRGAGFSRAFNDPFSSNASGGDGTDIGAFEAQASCLTPEQAFERLLDTVNAYCARPQPLRASLGAALASLRRGNTAAAVNQLGAFQNKVRAQVARDDPALAQALINTAQTIINAITK